MLHKNIVKYRQLAAVVCCTFCFLSTNAAEKSAEPAAQIQFHLVSENNSAPHRGYTAYKRIDYPHRGYTAYKRIDQLPKGSSPLAIMVENTPRMVTSKIKDARAHRTEFGDIVIRIQFNSADQKNFSQFTRKYTGRQVAIIIDGKLYTAPHISEPINSDSIEINGFSSLAEAEKLAGKLCPRKKHSFLQWLREKALPGKQEIDN